MQQDATALMAASCNTHLELARLLCEAGGGKDKANHHGVMALMLVSQFGHLDVVQLLCEAGGSNDQASESGSTA